MKFWLINPGPPRMHAVVLQSGDEVVATLTQFARDHQLEASQITAIGAFERAVVGYFELHRRDYRRIAVDEQVEVLSLLGDITRGDSGVNLHLHTVLGLPDGSTRGGHLLEAVVRPTLEVILSETPAHLQRRRDPQTGLALLAPNAD